MRQRRIGLGMLVVLSSLAAPPQAGVTPEAMLGAALHQERVAGNLPAAIEGYRKLLARKAVPRSLAAQAQYHLGICYEKLGNPDAWSAYGTVVRDYADQKDLAAQAGAAQARLSAARRGPVYRTTATLAVLPGNPFDSRLYSLQRNVLWRDARFRATRLSVRWVPDANFIFVLPDGNSGKAVSTVNDAMKAVVDEMDRRCARDPGYGRARIQSPARATTDDGRAGAMGVVTMEGMTWTPDQQRQTRTHIAALMSSLVDPQTLARVVAQGSLVDGAAPSKAIERIANEVRSSISFSNRNDSWLEVSLLSSDPGFLRRLLDSLPAKEVDLAGRIPLEDLDFVPQRLRRDWYMFNCCRVSPADPRAK